MLPFKIKLPRTYFIYLLMISLGILAGLSGIHYLQNFGLLLSDIFIKIFKCISTPIIALSIIVTLAGYNQDKSMKKIMSRTLLLTLSTTLIAATICCFLYILIKPQNLDQTKLVLNSIPVNTPNIHYGDYLISLIPSNIFTPFMDNQVIGLLFIGIIVGIAIRFIPDEPAKNAVLNFFKGLHGIFFVITKWVIAILPLGLFGFITTTVVQMQQGMNIGGIGKYLAIIVLANIIQGFIILPLGLKFFGIKPFETMRKMMPALAVAFFSKSSLGALPVTMSTAEKHLNISPKISRMVLPLCTSLNMNGCAAFIFATVIYLMQNYGVPITPPVMLGWILIATIAAIGNAGVPMGCFFLSASLLSSMNVPIILLGIILPFYSLIDMVETALNVWSDSCVAKIVDQQDKKDISEEVNGIRSATAPVLS